MGINRMRNLHQHIHEEIGKESVILLQKWEHLVRKLTDFGNHIRFTLRCLGAGVTLASVKIKNKEHLKAVKLLEKQKDSYKMNVLGPSIMLLS